MCTKAAAHAAPCLDQPMAQASPPGHVPRAHFLLFRAGVLVPARTRPVQRARRSKARFKALPIEWLRLTVRIAQGAMPLVKDEADLALQVVVTSQQLCGELLDVRLIALGEDDLGVVVVVGVDLRAARCGARAAHRARSSCSRLAPAVSLSKPSRS